MANRQPTERPDKTEVEGLNRIQKRASKIENDYYKSFVTNEINPLNSFVERNFKEMAFVACESSHATFFHFIDTLKVRGMARNLVSGDISHYFKNRVQEKPLISGVVSGFLGAAMGSLTFMTVHNYMTLYMYANRGQSSSL